jgi:hypothetical protein
VLEGYYLAVLEGYCLRPGTLAYGHTLSKECCLHSGRSRADALIEACASAGASPAHWRSTMVERESLTANVAPGGARNTAENVDPKDPRNTQEVAVLQKSLYSLRLHIKNKIAKITEDAAAKFT